MRRHVVLYLACGVLLVSPQMACGPTPTPTPPTPDVGVILVPSLARVEPDRGLMAGGETVTLSGSELDEVDRVEFGGAEATIQSVSSVEIVVTTPPHAHGAVDVEVHAPGGEDVLPEVFRFELGVTIGSIAPDTVPANQAAVITVQGAGFKLQTDAAADPMVQLGTRVLFDDRNIYNHNQLVLYLPEDLAVGSLTLTVTNSDGRSSSIPGALTVVQPIAVEAIDPAWAFLGDAVEVQITGSGFTGTQEVLFGTGTSWAPATAVTVVGSGLITAVAPASSRAGVVAVKARRGTDDEGVLVDGFEYIDPADTALRLLDVDPAKGRQAGGTHVDIWGTGFTPSSVFLLAGVEATVQQRYSTSRVQVTTPPYDGLVGELVAATVPVMVQDGEQDQELLDAFTYYRPPAITSVDPRVVSTAGGDTITIEGEGFTAGTTQVWFGSVEAPRTSVMVFSQAALTCTSPLHDEEVDVPVTVKTAFETSASYVGVTFVETTRIVQVTPDEISPAGRSFMRLVGTGLASTAGAMTVTIDGNPVDDLIRVDATTLTFRSRGPLTPGVRTLYLRNNDAAPPSNSHQVEITVRDFTDPFHLHGGGAISYNLNVSVLQEGTELPLDGAVAFVGMDGGVSESSYNKGVTNGQGMTVLSGSSVLGGPVTLTVGKLGFETQTVVGLDASDVTVLLRPMVPPDDPVMFGSISGGVFNWSSAGLPADDPRYYRLAQVYPSDPDPLTPNFEPGVEAWAIERRTDQNACEIFPGLDNNNYTVDSLTGTRAVLAAVFFWDALEGAVCLDQISEPCPCEGWVNTSAATFGLTTGVIVGGGGTGGININLDLGATTFNASFDDNPTLGGDNTAFTASAYLNLGDSGSFTFPGKVSANPQSIAIGVGAGDTVTVPMLQGAWTYDVGGFAGLKIPDEAGRPVGVDFPQAVSFVRGLTSTAPVTLTTWISFVTLAEYRPVDNQFVYNRESGGVAPDVTMINIYDTSLRWAVFSRGDPGAITLPVVGTEPRIEALPSGGHEWDIVQVKVPNFDFDDHTVADRKMTRWRAGTASETFVMNVP